MQGKPIHINIPQWITENEKYFLPPVCNKMMHKDGQLKVFFVGGPNVRKDYHLEEGEELFYMLKGDMCLKVIEHGRLRDVHIKEGEIFLLPAYIPHSPQRQKDTVGLVIERERLPNEFDALTYYVDETTERLFQRWFYCDDLGVQLGPVISEYFASEQHRTGKPIEKDLPQLVYNYDTKRTIEDPFLLHPWIEKHRDEIRRIGHKRVFDESYQFEVKIHAGNRFEAPPCSVETYVWQLEGTCTVRCNGAESVLSKDDSLLIPAGQSYQAEGDDSCLSLWCSQDPEQKVAANSE